MQQILIRRDTAFVIVSETNGSRLLRPTAMPVQVRETKPERKPDSALKNHCEVKSEGSVPKPPRHPPGLGEQTVLQGSNRGRGNRSQIRQMCASIVRTW